MTWLAFLLIAATTSVVVYSCAQIVKADLSVIIDAALPLEPPKDWTDGN
jgi:hypothetical protein